MRNSKGQFVSRSEVKAMNTRHAVGIALFIALVSLQVAVNEAVELFVNVTL